MPRERPLRSKTCEACAKTIYFMKSPNTRQWIPLSRVRSIYIREEDEEGQPIAQTLKAVEDARARGSYVYVSHFEMCTDPNRFSGRGRRS